MAKKLLDGKLGTFLKDKLPDAIGMIGEVLPDAGALGVVKNIIDKSTLTPAEKEEALALAREEEKLYMEDRADARKREVEMAKAGKSDYMMTVVGATILLVFVLTVICVFMVDLKNENLAHLLLGEILGFVGGIVFYYFGTSKSSSDKTRLLSK